MIWQCGKYAFDSRTPIVMGILNMTPDSFSDGGLYATTEEALEAARAMKEAGALIIDVGGESTRPGAVDVSAQEELSRVIEVVTALAAEGTCVSIDTRHAEVAQAAVLAGASIINDVTGFSAPEMQAVARECTAGLVVVHNGEIAPLSAQGDAVSEVNAFLLARAHELEEQGVAADRICLDPGVGFGKDYQQTKSLMRNFHELTHLGYPVMVAVSRKSYLGKMYGIEDPIERDAVSAAAAVAACEAGASVVRTHNVPLTVDALGKELRPYALIGLGANVALVANPGEELEAKKAQLNKAIGDMVMMPDTEVVDVAPFYESEPAYDEDQENFVNTVVLLRTGLPPQQLLMCLQAIENSLGRVRERENGPRTCDLDILDYQGYVADLENLVLPHPRILERDFVVKPLLDIHPNHVLADDTLVTAEQAVFGKAWRC